MSYLSSTCIGYLSTIQKNSMTTYTIARTRAEINGGASNISKFANHCAIPLDPPVTSETFPATKNKFFMYDPLCKNVSVGGP